MGSIFLVSLLVVSSMALSSQVPCLEGDCGEMTVYLGPKWGSKVIHYSNNSKFEKKAGVTEEPIPRVEEVLRRGTAGNDIPMATRRHQVYRRPIFPTSGVVIDDSLDYHHPSTVAQNIPTKDARWSTYVYGDVNSLVDAPTLNLSALGTTGDELKERLSLLNDSVSRLVTALYLDRNNIRSLPVLTFPVWMEYSLQELRLDDNPLPFLTPYTRFEISRLAKLEVLSLARTSLRYLDSLYLPKLRVLDLSNNRLSTVPAGLSSLQQLEQLYLAGNEILQVMPGSPLTDLSNLWLLSLESNRITHVWATSLYNVDMLYLNNNSLESFKEVKDTGARAVHLNGNPWQCSCPLLEAVHADFSQIIVDRYNLTCHIGEKQYLVMDLKEKDVQVDCPRWWDRFKKVGNKVGVFVRHDVLHRHVTWSTILTGLGWLTFILAVFLLTRSLRRLKHERDLQQLPYCILKDKNTI